MMRVKFQTILSVSALILFCAVFVSCTAFAASADADSSVNIVTISTENGDSYVRYPQLDGFKNTALQTAVNNAIVDEASITQRLITLSTLQSGGTGLQVSYTAFQRDLLLSVTISAKGMMENLRSGHVYTALSYDMRPARA